MLNGVKRRRNELYSLVQPAQKALSKKAILLVKQRLAEEEDDPEIADAVTDLFFVSFVAQ